MFNVFPLLLSLVSTGLYWLLPQEMLDLLKHFATYYHFLSDAYFSKALNPLTAPWVVPLQAANCSRLVCAALHLTVFHFHSWVKFKDQLSLKGSKCVRIVQIIPNAQTVACY